MWEKDEVVRHIGGRPFTREEVWSRILRARGLWSMLGYGYWAAYERGSGRFAGDIGFADLHRAMGVSIEGIPEMGWVFDPWCHGRGFAQEAVGAALRWGEANLEAQSYACIIDPENEASIRLARRMGFEESVRTSYKDAPTIIFRRSALNRS